MTSKQYFILGCKLFGVYFIVQAVSGLLSIIPFIVQIPQGAVNIAGLMLTQPLIFIAAGGYLIVAGEALYKFSYPEGSGDINLSEEKFLLYLKMLGVFMVFKYIPDFLKVLSEIFAVAIMPSYISRATEQRFMIANFAPSIWGVFAGIYLVKNGHSVAKYALKGLENK